MTEDEAKVKWCPYVRLGSESSGLGSLNRDVKYNHAIGNNACIGSACMAWRWDQDEPLCVVKGKLGQQDIITSVAAAEKHSWEIVRHLEPTGHCGLAGKP